MPSYDININTNDITKKGAAGVAGKTTGASGNESAEIAKLTKVLKASLEANTKSVQKALNTALRSIVQEALKSKKGDSHSVDVNRIVKDVARGFGKDVANVILTNVPKVTGGGTINQDAMSRAVSDGMMKVADKMATKMAINLSKVGINVDMGDIANRLSGIMREAYPKSAGKATRDLSIVITKLTSLIKDIAVAAASIKRTRISEGKVGISEIGPVLSDLKKIGKDVKELSGGIKEAVMSLRGVAKEGTEIYSRMKSTLTSVERGVKEKVRGVRERAKDDPKLFTKEIVTAFTSVLKKSEVIKGTELEKAINNLTGAIGDIPKLTSAMEDLQKIIQKEISSGKLKKEGVSELLKGIEGVVTVAGPLPKSMSGSRMPKEWQTLMSSLDRFLTKTAKITAQVKLIVDDNEIQKAVAKKYEIPVTLKTEMGQLKKSVLDAVTSAMTEAKKTTKKVKLEIADVTQEIKVAFDKGDLDKLVGALNKLSDLSGNVFKAPMGTKVPLSDSVWDKVTIALENVKNVQKQITGQTKSSFKDLVGVVGKFGKTVEEATNALSKHTDQLKDTITAGPQHRRAAAAVYSRLGEKRPQQGGVDRALLNQVGKYVSGVITPHPEGRITVRADLMKEGSVYKKQAEQQASQLSKSLYQVQKQIIDTLTKQFEMAGSKWAVVIDKSLGDPVKSFKLPGGRSGRQWTIEIANLKALERELGGMTGTAQELVRAYKSQYISKRVAIGTADKTLAVSVGKWLKTTSEAQIKSWDKITERQQKSLLRIKKGFEDIAVVSDEMVESIKGAFGSDLPQVFAETFGESEALRDLQQYKSRKGGFSTKLIRTLAIPAAKVTPTGGTAFETVHGSTRAIPKFATFETGFERLFTKLAEKGLVETTKGYSERIRDIGIRPGPSQYEKANNIAMELFSDLLSKPIEKLQDSQLRDINKQFIKQSYREAIKPKAFELKKTGIITDTEVFETKISTIMDEALKAGTSFNKFAATMEQAGLSAFDVVKSLDKLRFENVYDIYSKIFADVKRSPLVALGKTPQYEQSIREFEKAVGQVEGIMPLVEGGRPRRALHQESVVNLLTRTSQVYKEKEALSPDAQKILIKDLNLRLDEYIETAIGAGLAARKLPVGVRAISSLGIPEAQASSVEEFRPGMTGGTKYLNTLYATSVKMYADDLTAFAPFKQFQQAGRNIAHVTNAMADLGKTIETPRLRSAREKEVIESGRYGVGGYGYNVIAELRNTASTFEDQIVIGGKLAKAMTSAVSTLVKPSAGGRVRAGEEELIKGTGISTMVPKTLVDSVGEANRKILDVLGVEEKYKGRADKALIEAVTKTVAVVRGEDVEVQQAKLAETFLNYYGRKLTTRFGSKGVSITPTPAEQDPNIKQILQKYGDKDIKIAELGVALLPKTMGELAAELIEKNTEKIEKAFGADTGKFDVSKLASALRTSGNKFLLDLFKRTEENVVVIREEAEKTQELFNKYAQAFKIISGVAARTDVTGIGQLRDIYKEQVGGELITAKPIDVRISSYGVAKRGLQTELMESVFANVAGAGPKGFTTLLDEFKQSTIKDLLGGEETAGVLSRYSKALGFVGTDEPREGVAESLYKLFGGKGEYGAALKEGEDKALQAQRAAALESVSNYYSEIIDEMGKRRKSLVGTKFLEIIEEPHEYPGWQRGQIERGTKGARLNLPAFSAYATIFGEQSEFVKELQNDLDINAKKHWEYLKALQTILGKESEVYENLTKGLEEIDISTILPFERATGVYGGAAFMEDPVTKERVRNERSFSNTILDLERFSKAFKLMIPTGKYTVEGGVEKEPFYVPGPLARGTYPEPLIAGERGLDQISRRLTHLVNMAKELDEALKSPEAFFEPQYLLTKLPPIIGQLSKRASKLGAKGGTSEEELQELRDIYSQLRPGLSETKIPNQLLLFGKERALYGEQLSETQLLKEFESKQKEFVSRGMYTPQKALSNIINKMSDLLIGRRTGTTEELAAPAALQRIVREGSPVEVAGFAKTLGIDVVQDVLNKRMESLTKAKIDYYSTLAETALGKTGSINELFFSRKIPAIMGRAVTAVVDKRDDLKIFMNTLQDLETKFADSNIKGVEDLGDVSSKVSDIYKEHTEKIKGYKKAGIPILRQHELGVPVEFAKKVPVAFKRAAVVGRELRPAAVEEKGTLLELLQLKEKLQIEAKGDQLLEEQVNKFISDSLVPYIESIRFPFTGVSTIQPYKPKLLSKVGERGLEQQALLVPGVPEMDIVGFDKIISDLRDKVTDIMKQREEAFEKGAPQEETSKMTSLIDELNSAISAIIPKYVAHQQKLDFDGDQIEIHAATTARSRKEIESHFKRLTSFDKSTADVFRDVFSYGAKVPSTGEFAVGQMAGAFEKKFPAGKGFEFLKSPFLTKSLEYMTGPQALGVLGERPELGGMPKIIEDVLIKTLPELAKQQVGIDPKEILDRMDTVFSGVSKDTGTVADDLLQSIKTLDKDLGPQLLRIVEIGIKSRLYEEKKKDAIYAQLFKIHTGAETEGLTRIHRLAEAEVGFGGGLTGRGRYRPSEKFKERFPAGLKALGNRPEEEFHTMINEILRFGIQKGMDVKHAGERPVAGEIVKFLSKGTEGATKLWEQIEGTDEVYSELKDFAAANQTAIENRLGALPTGEILKEAKILTKARGEGIVLDDKTREELKKVIVDRVGLKGFLEELATMIQQAAIEGVIKDVESMQPVKKRAELKGQDIKSFAVGRVKEQIVSEGGIDVRGLVTAQQQPLYPLRSFGAAPGAEYKKFETKYGHVPTPKFSLPGMEKKSRERFINRYKAAVATAQNIQDELRAFGKVQQGGAYADMLRGAIDTLQKDQEKMESILTDLNKEGYDFASKNIELVERLTTGRGVSKFASEVINMKKGLKNRLEELSDVAAVPLLSELEELDLEQVVSPKLLDYKIKELESKGFDVSAEETKNIIEKFVNDGIEKAKALKQLDRVFESISAKRYEGRVISNLTSPLIMPGTEPVSPTLGASRQDIQKARDIFKTQALGRGGIGEAPAFTMPSKGAPPGFEARIGMPGGVGDIIPVHVVSVAEGVTVGIRDLESLGMVAVERAYGKPTKIEREDAAEKSELEQLIKKIKGIIPESALRSMKEVYSPSKLFAGGEYEYQARRREFDYGAASKQQIERIKKRMTTKEEPSEFMKAAGDVGTVIHAKLEQEFKKRGDIDTEVYGQMEDVFGGIIEGTADIIEYTSPEKEEIKRIGDIKTTNKKTIAELDKISKEKVLYYEDIKDKLSGKLAFKIEEAVSQLNAYLKIFENKLAEGAEAEIRFYDQADLGKDIEEYKAVRFVFSEPRLHRDMMAVAKARQQAISEGLPFVKTASTGQAVGAGATSEEIQKAAELAQKQFRKVSGRPSRVMARDPQGEDTLDRKLREAVERVEKRVKSFSTEEELDRYLMPPPIAEGTEMGAVFENLKTMHDQARLYQSRKGIDVDAMKRLPKQISGLIEEAETTGGDYQLFIDVIDKLRELDPTGKQGGISGMDIIRAWKLYRLAIGEFMIKQAEAAKKEMEELESAGEQRGASRSYGLYQKRVSRLQDFISRSVGKRTDIYTDDRRFITPGLARAAGVYQTPEQIIQKASEPLGEEDVKLRKVFDKLTESLKAEGGDVAPLEKIREALSELSGMDKGLVAILTNAEKVRRLGPQVVEAWADLDKLSDRVTRLREALQKITRFNRDEFDAVQRKNLENMVKYLKSIENMYSQMDLGGATKKQQGYGEMGLIKVPKFMAPEEQRALHARNILKVREYFRRPKAEGGPEVGTRFSYMTKITGSAGETIKQTVSNFYKYGEVITKTGDRIGKFSQRQRDLIKHMQRANASFSNAIRRVVMWGAASRLIYGGISYLNRSLSTLSEIEQGIAQLRMVMSPLQTDFGRMQKAAVGFSKEYGVPTTDVLKSMKIFAQQGLTQQEVIERTETATLASNVTTLSAKEATEALTAAMKVFRSEGQQSLRFLDAWSETEAKHAITAADMANAIKKSAAAARTAGVDFDELNGIVAAIGSVTRQSGKEVGTSLRFIFRRLFAEKGPKELAKFNIPVLEDTGELRRGFDVLGDLASKWKNLGAAQKLSLAQAIGGTRQYNALIVLMNNWDEAVRGIQNSINSKGSAERRNLEIMKTYAKQLEQTKAAATEFKLSLGKIVLPVFKTGLTAVRTLLEGINSIPNSLKAVAAFGALFVGYAAKGLSLVAGIRETLAKGGTLFGDLGRQLVKQLNIAKFEVLGKGTRGLDLFGLKTVTPKAAEIANKLRKVLGKAGPGKIKEDMFTEQGKHLADFHSGLGQLVFIIKSVGDAYNSFIGSMITGTGKATQKVGDMTMKVGDFMSVSGGLVTRDVPIGEAMGEASKFVIKEGLSSEAVKRSLAKHGFLRGMTKIGSKVLGVVPELMGFGLAVGGKAISGVGGLIGKGGEKVAEKTGLAKALGPLAVTTLALLPAMKAVYEYWSKIINSAQDYEKSMAGVRRKTESEHKTIRDMSNEYDTLISRLEEVKELSKPAVKIRRQELETYTAPLVLLQPLQEDAIALSNKLASENINLVLGYDKLGNAVLKTTDNFRKYLSELDKLKVKEAAQTEIDILDKYIYDLTTTEGPEKWKKTIKSLLESTPIFGDLAGTQIKISPAAVLEEAAKKLNKLINIKNKYPLSTAADEDIKRLQSMLDRARGGYQDAFSDFQRIYSRIVSPSSLRGLTTKDITTLLSQDVLRKAYELELKINPKFKLVSGIKPEDIMGKEILTAISPKTAGLIDVTAEFTKANIESAGIKARKGGIIKPGDLVTFIAGEDATRDIAGRQALVKYKETVNGVFEWMIQYFNTKTLKVEERPFDKDIERVVDNIFPLQKIQEELEFRMDALNTFVSGAAAGLTGISAKEFKKDFSLGERFFGSIPTTTLVQATKGFTPGKGFGPVEFKKDWYREIDKYFFKPMEEFQRKAAELSKLKLGGLEDITLSKQLFEELTTLNEVLKNNQVAIQFRALYSDLEKTFAEGERVLKEGLAINAVRREVDLETGGLMTGISRGLSNIDLGVIRPSELSVQQRLLRGSPEFRQRAGGIQDLEIVAESLRSKMDAVARAMVNIDTIAEQARGFGAEIKPEDMEQFVEKVIGTEGLEGIEKLIDIDTSVAEHTSNTVSRLDDILSNMNDPEALERTVKEFSTPERISTGAIPDVLERLARMRERFEERGEQENVVSINRMIDNLSEALVSRLGFKESVKVISDNFTFFRKRFKPEEMAQRAFGGSDLKTIFSKVSEYAPEATGGFLGMFKKKSFEDSKELSKLRQLQEDDGKKTVGLSRTIAKLAAVATVVSAFQKGGTNEIVGSLDKQLSVLDEQIKYGKESGKTEKDMRDLFIKKEGITERRDILQSDVDFYGMVQNLSGLTTIAAELASAFGLTEKQVKYLGVGSLGTYAAVKLASTVLGKEMPESAKIFGEELKNVTSKIIKGEDVKWKSAGKAATAFTSDIKEKTKKVFKKKPEELKREADEEKLREAYTKYKTKIEDVDPVEYERLIKDMFSKMTFEAGEIGEGAARAGGAGPDRFKQVIAAYIAATVADFTTKRFEDKQLMNTLESAAKKQSKQLGKLLLKYPEAAQKALDELKSSSNEVTKEVQGSFRMESRLLDPREEQIKVEGAIQKFGEHTADAYAKIMREIVTKKAIVSYQQFAEEFSMAIESTNKNLSEYADRMRVESKYGQAARLNKSLVGFGGEAALPLFKRQMSVQQKVYTEGPAGLRESITAYATADNAINIVVSSIEDLMAKAREQRDIIKASSDTTTIKLAKEQHEKLNEEIKRQSGVLDDFIEKMREFGQSKRYLDEFSGSIYKLNDAIREIGIDQKVEELPGFRGAMDEIDKLLGGPHPLARYIPTVEEERMAGKQGILVSTKQDVERARLLEQLRSSGQDFGAIYRKIIDLPLETGRETYRTSEQREAERLREQVAPYKTFLRDLEAVKHLEGLPEEEKERIGDLQGEIIRAIRESVQVAPKNVRLDELQDAFFSFSNLWKNIRGRGIGLGEYREEFKKIKKGEEDQYRGITLEDKTGVLSERIQEIRESMVDALKEAPTFDMMEMRAAIAEPVVTELQTIQALLMEQAKEMGDEIDLSNLESVISRLAEASANREKKATGGLIVGPGGSKGDKIPAYLSSGEYVVKTDSAKKLGYGTLNYINEKGKIPGFAEGGTVFGRAAGVMEGAADFFKRKRLDISDWIYEPKTRSGVSLRKNIGEIGMGAMAIPDIGLRMAKAPLDVLSMIEGLSQLQVEGKLGETAKGAYSAIKGLDWEQIKDMGKGVVKAAGEDISTGGTGIAAGILESLIPVGLGASMGKKGMALLKTAAPSGKGFLKETLASQKGAVELTGLKGVKEAKELLESAVYETGSYRYPNLQATAILTSKYSDDILKQIPKGAKILDQMGTESIVLSLPGGKEVMRIGDLLPERPNIPSVLQASKRKVFGNIQVETVPRVKTEGITEADVNFMRKKLENTDYEFSDPHYRNFGRTKKGKLIILDPGAVRKREVSMKTKSFTQTFKETASETFDPDEAGRMLETFLGEEAHKVVKKKILTSKDILTKLEEPDMTNNARRMAVTMFEDPSTIKPFKIAKGLHEEKLKGLGTFKELWGKPGFQEMFDTKQRGQFFREAEESLAVLKDPTVDNSATKSIHEFLAGKTNISKFAYGGVVGKEGIIDQDRLQEALLQMQGMKSEKEKTIPKVEDRKWWKFWGRKRDEEKVKQTGGYTGSWEPSRGAFGTLGYAAGAVERMPRHVSDFVSDTVGWGASEVESLWGDTKTLGNRFGGWIGKQHDIYSNPENYVEAFKSGIKDPLYNELMLDRDLLVNKFRGIKDFFANSMGSFKYYMDEDAVLGGYKPIVTPKIKRAYPTKDNTWLKTLKWMADVTPSGISGKMEGIYSMLSGGFGTVTGGLAGIAGLPSGLEQATKNIDRVSKMLTYIPQKEKGAESLGMMAAPFQWYGSIGDKIGDEVLDVTGSSNKAAFVSSLFKGAPALAAFSMGTSGSATGPVVGYLARKKFTFPGTGRLSKKVNKKIEAASAKYEYIDALKSQLARVKDKKGYSKIQSKIENKLAKTTGSLTKGQLQTTAGFTGILAARQYAKDLKDQKNEVDMIEKLLIQPNGVDKIKPTEKLDQGKSYRTLTMGSDNVPIWGTVTQKELDERKQRTIKKYGVKSEVGDKVKKGLSKYEYFTNYGGETVGYSSKEEYDEARKRFTMFGTKGDAKTTRKKLNADLWIKDEDLFTKISSFGKEHKEPAVQDIKHAYDNLVKLSDLVVSGEFKNTELGRYKLGMGKGFGDTLTSDEQKSFEDRYKTSTNFILDKYMQSHKALKNILLPPDKFLTEENTVLHNRVVDDSKITQTMLGGATQYKRAKLFGSYEKARSYYTIDPNLANEYKRQLQSGTMSEEKKKEYEAKFEILKTSGGKELFASLSPEYKKKYNQFRKEVLMGNKSLQDAKGFFDNIRNLGTETTAFTKEIRPYPPDVEAIIKNIMDMFVSKEKGLVSIGRVTHDKEKMPSERNQYDILRRNETRFWDMLKWMQEGKQESLKQYAQGGVVTKTGPLFAHKGEYVVPKGYKEGGIVADATLTRSVAVDDGKWLAQLKTIKLEVEDKKLEVEDKKFEVEDKTFQVDEPTWKIGVDVPTDVVEIKVDLGDAASRLKASISEALNKPVKVEVMGNLKAVGGEKLDILAGVVKGLEDRLLYVKNDLETKINAVGGGEELEAYIRRLDGKLKDVKANLEGRINIIDLKALSADNYQLEVKINALIRSQVSDIERQLISIRGDSADQSGYISRVESKLGHLLEDLERRLSVVFNMAPIQGYL